MSQGRRSPRFISGGDDFDRLADSEREQRSNAMRVLRLARSDRLAIEDAARRVGVSMRTVRQWVPEALRSSGGATFPTGSDNLFRVRPMALDGAVGFIGVWGPEQAAAAERIFATQWDYLHGIVGADALRRLPATFAGLPVVRDPRELERLARRDGFNIDEVYRELFS